MRCLRAKVEVQYPQYQRFSKSQLIYTDIAQSNKPLAILNMQRYTDRLFIAD